MSRKRETVLGKRRRSWDTVQDQVTRDAVEAHIELEASLRQRMMEAAGAKILWAETMRQALIQSIQDSADCEDESVGAFQAESTHTLSAIELLQPLALPPPTPVALVDVPVKPTDASSLPLRIHSHLPLRESDENENPPYEENDQLTKSLFILQHSFTDRAPVTVLIACEVCSRSDFPTIHSLLSHSRMSHGILYRSHEELVGRCGRIVTGVKAARIRINGTEASSRILMGMRSVIEQGIQEAESGHPNALARTLGLHADSAALASFLGKEPRAHSIRLYEPTGNIDIETVDDNGHSPKVSAFSRRNVVRPGRRPRKLFGEPADDIELQPLDFNHVELSYEADSDISNSASRFHIKRRLVITDSSYFVLEKDRISPDMTHQWMITVSAPSYSDHITTFVSKLSVSKADVDRSQELNIEEDAVMVDRPPFSAAGLANEPFLAQLRVEWPGGPSKALSLTHWVRLNASKASRVVVGEDQILDVELDRTTPFQPERQVPPLRFPVTALSLRELQFPRNEAAKISQAEPVPSEEPSEKSTLQFIEPTLKKLVSKIPMTSQDLRARAVDGKLVSYILPRSLNDLLKLDHGRRKAYEWRHALSLRGALLKHAPSDHTLIKHVPAIKNITTGMLYRWMDEQDIFARPVAPFEEPVNQIPLDSTFCRFCGLALDAHPEKQEEPDVVLEDRIEDVVYSPPPRRPILCQESFRLPPIISAPTLNLQTTLDDDHLVNQTTRPSAAERVFAGSKFSKDLLRWTDPALTLYIQDLTASFHLTGFEALSLRLDETLFAPGRTKIPTAAEVIAPHALLAQCLRVVVKELVGNGVDVAKNLSEQVKNRRRTELIAQAFAAGDPFPSIPEDALTSSAKQVLTPSHVLRGLSSPSRRTALLRLAVSRFPADSALPIIAPTSADVNIKREDDD